MENLNESLVTSNPDKSEIPEKEPDNQTKRQRPDNDNGNPESQEVQALEAIALQEAMDPLGALGERVRSFVTENLGEVEREDRTGTEMPCETNKNDEGKRDDLSDDEQMEVEPSDEEKGEEEVGLEYGTSCVVVQAQNGQVVVVTKKQKKNWPRFIGIPNDLSTDADRQLRMGDEVEVVSFEWRSGYEALSEIGQTGGRPQWIHVGNINSQALATNVRISRSSKVVPTMGIVLQVNRRPGQGANTIQSVTVITHGMKIAQRLPRWMLGGKDWFRTGQTVLVETVELTRPNMWKVNAGYALPYGCPFGLQGERRAHKPLVAIGADRAPILHKFPFRQTDSDVMVEQAEEVIAAAITACLDKVEEDIERFTITAEPKVNTGGPSGTAVVSIRHVIEKKQQFVSMAKMWSEDQPIHVRLSAEGAKPCATGFIQSVQRQEHEQGFLLLATLFLTFQEAKGYDSWEDWDKIMDGAKMDVEPLHSRKTLMQRSSKFALHQFTEGAKDNSATGKIMAILMARQGERVPPALTWEELLVAHNPALNDLVGGQRKTAQLMLDTVPRVVYQQAPPGTGKTKVSMDIVAAHLRANPEAHVLFVAPLNVAVVKAVEEMAKTMTKIGWKEEMLALFSGSGKKKYFQELAKIGDHLLAAALRAPQLFERLDRQQSNVVKRYIKACETSPRTANEGKAAQILLGFEKRRIVFCTLSLAEQIGGIFGDTDMIVVDESGQASFAQLMSTLLNFPALGKLLVTGDKWQLKVNLEDVPDATRVGCGLDTVIINLDEAAGVDRTTLTVNFRSHPMLTQCIEAGVYAAHGEKLISGRSAEEMNRITVSTPIFLPVQDCPLVLLHQTDRMVQDPTSFSATNPEQTRTVVNCVAMLRPRLTGLIRIVCFYAGQAKELGMAVNELNYEDVLVTTADGCQGHEAEFVFVVTTKAGLSAMDASGAFWNDERRVNVALSRAKFGMMVIGDLKLLWQAGGIWRRFLRKALESTIAVAPEYIEAMANPSSEYIDGMLNGPNGPVKAADFYDEWSGGSGFDPIPQQMASAHRPATSSSQAPSPRRGPSTSSPGLCHQCLRPGHFVRECPERRGTSRGTGRREWVGSGQRREGRRNN